MKPQSKAAFGKGDDVLDRRGNRTGKVVGVRPPGASEAPDLQDFHYVVRYGSSVWEANERDLTLLARAPQTKDVDGLSERIAAKKLEATLREAHLVNVLSGGAPGCLPCAHLEMTTKGKKTLCFSHRPNRPKGVS